MVTILVFSIIGTPAFSNYPEKYSDVKGKLYVGVGVDSTKIKKEGKIQLTLKLKSLVALFIYFGIIMVLKRTSPTKFIVNAYDIIEIFRYSIFFFSFHHIICKIPSSLHNIKFCNLKSFKNLIRIITFTHHIHIYCKIRLCTQKIYLRVSLF